MKTCRHNQPRLIKELVPGDYRFSIELECNDDLGGAEVPGWRGKIVSEPVIVEIAAEKKAAH